MNESKLATIEQVREFLADTADVTFAVPTDEAKRRATTAARKKNARTGASARPG